MNVQVLGAIVASLVFAAGQCGGEGGGGETNTGGTRADPPIAAPGRTFTASLSSFVTLDGSASSNPAGGPLRFGWVLRTIPEGSNATLLEPTTAQPTFFADVPGTYEVRLIVSNGSAWSDPSIFTITVDRIVPDPNNLPPVARIVVANRPPTGTPDVLGAPLYLDGTTSSDREGKALSYTWILASRPKESHAVLGDATSSQSSLTPDVNGSYVIQLFVRDDYQPSPVARLVLDIDSRTWAEKLQTVSYRQNAQRTNAFTGGSMRPPLRQRFWIDLNGEDEAGYPLLTGDTVYFTKMNYRTEQPWLYAYKLDTGEEKFPPVMLCVPGGSCDHDAFRSYITISDGVVYSVGYYGDIFAIDANDGHVRWSLPGPKYESLEGGFNDFFTPPLNGGGFFVGSGKLAVFTRSTADILQRLVVFNEDSGQFVQAFGRGDLCGALINNQNHIFHDMMPSMQGKTIYVGSECASLFAFDVESGTQKWQSEPLPAPCTTPPFIQDVVRGDTFVVAQSSFVVLNHDVCDVANTYSEGTSAKFELVYDNEGNIIRKSSPGDTVFAVEGENGIHSAFVFKESNSTENGEWLESVNILTGQSNWRRRAYSALSPYDPLIVNDLVFFGARDGRISAYDKLSGKRVWSDRVDASRYAYLSDDWMQMSTNGEVLAFPSKGGLTIYEVDPTPPDESYKTRCDAPGNQFHAEGTASRMGTNGLPLEDGTAEFQGSITLDDTTARFTVNSAIQSDGAQDANVYVNGGGTGPTGKWSFRLKSDPKVRLAIGQYPHNSDAFMFWSDSSSGLRPFIDVSYETGVSCSDNAFRYEVTDLELTPAGDINKIALNFVQHCSQKVSALRGCVKWERPKP